MLTVFMLAVFMVTCSVHGDSVHGDSVHGDSVHGDVDGIYTEPIHGEILPIRLNRDQCGNYNVYIERISCLTFSIILYDNELYIVMLNVGTYPCTHAKLMRVHIYNNMYDIVCLCMYIKTIDMTLYVFISTCMYTGATCMYILCRLVLDSSIDHELEVQYVLTCACVP